MRAYLIDATTRTITAFDYVDHYHEPAEILGGASRGDFGLGSGPLNPPQIDADDGYLADYLYIRESLPQSLAPKDASEPPIVNVDEGSGLINGDPRFWFQIDADLDPPATFPIPGRGLVIGVDQDGLWSDARITLKELTERVRFTRRKLRGFTISTAILKGEIWTGPVAPIIEEH